MKVDRDLDGDFVDELVQSGVELARLGLRGRDTHPEQRVARLQGAEADAEVADVTGRRLQAGAGERTRQLTRLAVAQRPIETQRRHACDERERRLVNVQAHQVDGHLRTLADALQRHADADARQADHVNVHFVLKKKKKIKIINVKKMNWAIFRLVFCYCRWATGSETGAKDLAKS